MTGRAVLEARGAQIMERRRHAAQLSARCSRNGQIRVALQAYGGHLVTGQHSWIRRPMRFVTRGATFLLDHGMFEYKRAALIAMALQAAWLVSERRLHAVCAKARVRIVAIDAGHRAFRQSMLVRPVECRPLRHMTRRTLGIHFVSVVHH